MAGLDELKRRQKEAADEIAQQAGTLAGSTNPREAREAAGRIAERAEAAVKIVEIIAREEGT